MLNRLTLQKRFTLVAAGLFVLLSVVLTFALLMRASSLFTLSELLAQNGADISSSNEETFSALLRSARRTYLIQSTLILFALLTAGTVLLWFLTKKMLRPVTRLTEVIENIDEDNLPESVDMPYKNDEVIKLTNAFNRMMKKINNTMEGQKRFVQNAAHELKTPLSSIMTNIEVLEMDENASVAEYKEVLSITKDNVERMNELVKDLLQMTQLEQKSQTTFSFKEMSIFNPELLEEMKEKGIHLEQKGDTRLTGSKPLLERAFANIVHNAVRYNRKGGEISIICDDDEITIADTGIGIPADKKDKIFEPFYCVDFSRSRSLGGSGLGLSIVRQIFFQHDIGVSVESEEEKGTKFEIILNS